MADRTITLRPGESFVTNGVTVVAVKPGEFKVSTGLRIRGLSAPLVSGGWLIPALESGRVQIHGADETKATQGLSAESQAQVRAPACPPPPISETARYAGPRWVTLMGLLALVAAFAFARSTGVRSVNPSPDHSDPAGSSR